MSTLMKIPMRTLVKILMKTLVRNHLRRVMKVNHLRKAMKANHLRKAMKVNHLRKAMKANHLRKVMKVNHLRKVMKVNHLRKVMKTHLRKVMKANHLRKVMKANHLRKVMKTHLRKAMKAALLNLMKVIRMKLILRAFLTGVVTVRERRRTRYNPYSMKKYRMQIFIQNNSFTFKRKENNIVKCKVCGSDGKTYSNKCELKNYACRISWDITMVSKASYLKTLSSSKKYCLF